MCACCYWYFKILTKESDNTGKQLGSDAHTVSKRNNLFLHLLDKRISCDESTLLCVCRTNQGYLSSLLFNLRYLQSLRPHQSNRLSTPTLV